MQKSRRHPGADRTGHRDQDEPRGRVAQAGRPGQESTTVLSSPGRIRQPMAPSFAALAALVVLAVLTCGRSQPAHAYMIETLVTPGCHESITFDALADQEWPGGTRPAAVLGGDPLLDDLPFSSPGWARHPWVAAVLIGVRYNDIGDNSSTALDEIVHVHNDPDLQHTHCLRRREHDGPEGDRDAVMECRDFIMAQVERALGNQESLDLDESVEVAVVLAFRGRVEVPVSRFGFNLGRAFHALQDGYSHVYRSPESDAVVHVLNWIEYIRADSYNPVRDGDVHNTTLDDCTRDVQANQARVARATAATRALWLALADDTGGRAGRLQRAAMVLDEHMAYEPGCTFDNSYCDAPEQYEGAGCSVSPGPSGGLPYALVTLFALSWLWRSRQRRQQQQRRQRERRAWPWLAALALLALSWTDTAHADCPCEHEIAAARPEYDRSFGVAVRAGASLDNAAVAMSVGLRFQPRAFGPIGLGIDAEYNPFFTYSTGRFAPGTANVYATGTVRWRHSARWQLRSSTSVGVSTLLFDLVGVDRGSTGIFWSIAPLAVSLDVSRRSRVVLEPLSLAIPVPKLGGFPYYRRQYRASLAFERYF